MKNLKVVFLSMLAILLITTNKADAFFLDDATFMNQMQDMMSRFTTTTTDQTAQFVTTMEAVNTQYLNATLQLSTDIGAMSDRIIYTEELIGQMSDRIVRTESMMAQMTVLLAQIAAGQNVDPATVAALQDAINGTCQDPTIP